MAFRRPTLSQLIQIAISGFNARLSGADGTLRRSNINVIATVLGGLVNGLYGFVDWCALQILPNQKQDPYFTSKWGNLFRLSPIPSVAASGNAIFTGTAIDPIPSGTLLTDGNGNEYKTTADGTLAMGTVTIPCVALIGGAFGNLAPGAILTLETAIAGVDATATVDEDGFSGGLDAETNDAFRARIVNRMQNPPGGSGTVADYEKWAKEAGVGATRATAVGAARGAGTVDVRFVIDGRADITPTTGERNTVLAYINSVQPLTDIPGTMVQTTTAESVSYTLSAANVPASSRDAVQAALVALHLSLNIGDGLSLQSQVIPAIAAVQGVKGNFLVEPSSDIAPDATKVLTLALPITYS